MDSNNSCFLDMEIDQNIEHYFPGGKAEGQCLK